MTQGNQSFCLCSMCPCPCNVETHTSRPRTTGRASGRTSIPSEYFETRTANASLAFVPGLELCKFYVVFKATLTLCSMCKDQSLKASTKQVITCPGIVHSGIIGKSSVIVCCESFVIAVLGCFQSLRSL